jgi:hypothetical protein
MVAKAQAEVSQRRSEDKARTREAINLAQTDSHTYEYMCANVSTVSLKTRGLKDGPSRS